MVIPYLAPRISRVRPSPTAEISKKVRALKAAGRSVINLGEGELDFDTPAHIKKAGAEAIWNGETKYTAVAGTPGLKQAIIDKFRSENQLDYRPEQIIAGCGAKQLIFNALLATPQCTADDRSWVIRYRSIQRPLPTNVRCYSNSGQTRVRLDCPLSAIGQHRPCAFKMMNN